MTEYVPCFLVREYDHTCVTMEITQVDDWGNCSMRQVPSYREKLIPVEMSELVALMQGKKTLLPGPFRLSQVPEWAKAWFTSKQSARK